MIDPRGTRFSAALTVVMLALVILTTPGPVATVLLSLQTLVFAFGAILGPGHQPPTAGSSKLVRPRLKAPDHMEAAPAVRAPSASGSPRPSISMLLGLDPPASTSSPASLLFAAALNAVFGFCLGCEIYLRIRRFLPSQPSPRHRRPILDLTDPPGSRV